MKRARIATMWLCGAAMAAIGAQAAPAPGPLRGVETVPGILPWHDETSWHVTNGTERPLSEPVTLVLSRHRYPAEDGHLDALVWLDWPRATPVPGGLEVQLFDADGRELSSGRIEDARDSRLFFSYRFPPELAGSAGRIEVAWKDGEEERGRAERAFVIAAPAVPARSGQVPITVANTTGAHLRGAPMTVGVPFPRGALADGQGVRLLDEAGREVPAEVTVTGRWSRFGSVKWLRCDFTADLDGERREFRLEYGPEVRRAPSETLPVRAAVGGGFPSVDAGRLSVRGDGVYGDVSGHGDWRRALTAQALHGGFVRREDGRLYRMPEDMTVEVEEAGSGRVTLLARGYYREADSGEAFCQYHTRYVLHRDSPVIRIVHTWIFTGDGNAERIANMGWRFELDEALAPEGFLDGFGPEGSWREGDSLLQHDFDRHEIAAEGLRVAEGGRAAGAASAVGGGLRLLFGARDFWQNFPSELEFAGGALYFHNWPRHGRPARHRPATVDDAIRLWFVHEGEMLDFRIPEEYTRDPIYQAMSAGRGAGMHWLEGQPETANAQGIARTEEMWLVLTDEADPLDSGSRLVEGLDEGTLRPVVDPAWLAASGAFHEIRHRDAEAFPAHEAAYEETALAPMRWNERIGIYGMWIYGENLWGPYLHSASADLYRAFRKSHHRWPYSWIPYVRSGDARFLRPAHAATRQMVDANYCHYVTDEVAGSVAPKIRRRGMQWKSLVPWAGQTGPTTRAYHHQVDYLWHAWYVADDRRVLDVIRSWQEDVKVEEPIPHHGPIVGSVGSYPHRQRVAMLHAGVDMYEATFDPWFLALSHAIAELDMAEFARGWRGHTWRPGPREFLRFTGDPEYREFYLAYADHLGSVDYARWAGQTQIESNAYAWWLTGEDRYLRRLAHELDWARQAVFRGEPEYYRGYHVRGSAYTSAPVFTCWYLYQFPLATAALAAADREPAPLPNRFWQGGEEIVELGEGVRVRMPLVAFRKRAGASVPVRLEVMRMARGRARYRLSGPDGEAFLEGGWEGDDGPDLEVPADAPAGTYRLRVDVDVPAIAGSTIYPTALKVPVTPDGTPEVMLPREPAFRRAVFEAQYWFRMPGDVETFEAEFPVDGADLQRRPPVRRMTVWDADGHPAWDHHMTTDHLGGRREVQVRARVPVPPDQRGRLWRITLPGRNLGFRIHSGAPVAFAAAADRWFDPGETD